MKTLKHILSIVVWTVVGIHLCLFALLKISAVQEFVGSEVASMLGERLGTKVSIGRVNIGLFDRVVIDDISIEDQSHKDMLRAKRVSAKISIAELVQGKISISSAQLIGARLSLYQPSPTSKTNFQFVLDSLASKDTLKRETRLDLRISSFIMHRASLDFDKYYEPETPSRLNLSHIHISDMGANMMLDRLTNDSINLNVKKLTVREQSGLWLKKLSFRLAMGKNAAQLNGFVLEMPNTTLRLGETTASYTTRDNKLSMPSLKFKTSIDNATISLAEFSPLFRKFESLDERVRLRASISGAGERVDISSLALSTLDHEVDIAASGSIAKRGDKYAWSANAKKLELKASAIAHIWHTLAKDDAPMPAMLERVGDIALRGNARCSTSNDLQADGRLTSAIGTIDAKFSMDGSKHFAANVDGKDIELGKLLATDQLGSLSATINANGELPAKIEAKCDVTKLVAKGHTYGNIQASGQYSAEATSVALNIDDPALRLALEGSLANKATTKEAHLTASVRDFSPNALNLTSKWEHKHFSFDLVANLTGNYDNNTGTHGQANVEIGNIMLVSPDTTYTAGNVTVFYNNAPESPRVEMNSDFAKLKLEGKFGLSTLVASYTNILSNVIPGMPGLQKHVNKADNDFVLTANVSDAEFLRQLFGLKLSIDSPVSLTTMVKDRDNKASLSLSAPAFAYDGNKFEGLTLDLSQPDAKTVKCDASLTKVMSHGDKLSAVLKGIASNNKLKTSLALDNDAETFSSLLNTSTSFFVDDRNQQTAMLEIEPSQLKINGQQWEILPAVMTYSKKNLQVDGFSISNGRQFLAINGKSTASTGDSLTVQMNGIDVAYVLNLINFHSVEFGGEAYGKLYAKGLFSSAPQLYGKLRVSGFTFQDGGMGTLIADARWNSAKGQIDIDAVADDEPTSRTLINGYISPTHNNIDLSFEAKNTRLDFLMSFTHAFLSRLDGKASGKMRLVGPLSAMDLLGRVSVDGVARVKVLGCDYALRGDSVDFVHNDILFNGTRIYDRDGNVGYVYGGLHHENLKRMTYDLDIKADNLLSYDFDNFYGQSFYATVYASGDVKIHGVPGLLQIDVNATPMRGTTFVYNVSNPDAVANQKFIVWNEQSSSPATTATTSATPAAIHDDYDLPSDIRINFIVNCNQDATLKLLMDSNTNDYITLYGDGVINADYYNNGAFKMTGTYRVDHGTYGITIQNIIKKNFIFSQGGTIIFGGDPFDAALNLEASYMVNGVSLSDLNVGSSFKSNTIKVNCLMNIGGIAQRPAVTFDLDLPTLGTDEKQMVKSVINGEEEMNQQVIYLLGIGRFYPQGNNNATAQGGNQPGQTSLAMQSLLSGTISSQINQLLNTVVNNNNWNFGANISTGDEGWNNAEYEGLLSGQLLNNRLLINGQFGYRDSKNTATTSFIGDFDIKYLLVPNGNLALKVYNQTNDRYFTKSSLNTQGVGLIMKKDFNGLRDLFRFGKKKKAKK